MQNRNPIECVDHLVLAVPDLEPALEEMQQRAGIRPAIGGRHPNWGTRNAVLSLGPTTYLELIAPDPDSDAPVENRPAIFSTIGSPRMIGWFARCDDLDAARQAAASAGVQLGSIMPGSRTLPDGQELRWQLTDPMVMVFDGIFPMLIDWGDSPHPAASAPGGCRLLELELVHPEAAAVMDLMNTVDLPGRVTTGQHPAMSTTIQSPNGTISLP